MASSAVVTAVGSRLGSPWISIDGTRIAVVDQNTLGEVPAAPFISVQFPVAREDHVGMAGVGNRSFRESGAIRIVLTVPRGIGQAKALGYIDELRALFRATQFAGVSTLAPSPAINNDANEVAGYWVLSFSVPYWFYLLA